MGFFKEFKTFAMKGSVLDLAVAVIIGAAFGGIVKSLVDDIITPAILNPTLKAAHLSEISKLVIPGTAIKYGNFISQIISFLLIAASLFLILKVINTAKRKEEAKLPAGPSQEQLLTEIRDLLKNKTIS